MDGLREKDEEIQRLKRQLEIQKGMNQEVRQKCFEPLKNLEVNLGHTRRVMKIFGGNENVIGHDFNKSFLINGQQARDLAR